MQSCSLETDSLAELTLFFCGSSYWDPSPGCELFFASLLSWWAVLCVLFKASARNWQIPLGKSVFWSTGQLILTLFILAFLSFWSHNSLSACLLWYFQDLFIFKCFVCLFYLSSMEELDQFPDLPFMEVENLQVCFCCIYENFLKNVFCKHSYWTSCPAYIYILLSGHMSLCCYLRESSGINHSIIWTSSHKLG